MFIPQKTTTLSPEVKPQIRLLLLGRPGSGKTYTVCTTFPNVIVADFDNGLTSPVIRALKLPTIPFYDDEWVSKAYNIPSGNSALAFKHFLQNDAKKLQADQTLFVDSLSALQASFHQGAEKSVPISKKTGEKDGYYVWNEKQTYMRDIHWSFKALKCSVVVAAHEKEERDPDTGALLSKVSPFMTGGFVAELGSHYSDIFRAFSREDRDASGKSLGTTSYLWQVRPDDKYDLKSRMNQPDRLVKAGYALFEKGY